MEEKPPSNPLPPSKPGSLLNRLIDLDTRWSLYIHTICQPLPRFILKALEISGDGRFWFPIPVAFFFTLSSKSNHLRSILIGLLIGSLLDLLFVGLIKFLVRRPRPVYNKGMHLTVAVDHWSFPSGHSSRVCFISSFLYFSSTSIAAALVELGYAGHRWIGSDGVLARFTGGGNVFFDYVQALGLHIFLFQEGRQQSVHRYEDHSGVPDSSFHGSNQE